MSDFISTQPWLYWSVSRINRSFLKLYFSSITIHGQEHLLEHGPCVLASKHFSRWDPLVLSLLDTEPLRFMTNENQFAGVQGWMIARLGAFPVNLSHPSISSLRYAVELLRDRQKLGIFPEGGIVRDQPLRPFKSGLARLVLQAEATAKKDLVVPIIPIALHYTPSASAKAEISIYISPPLYTYQYQRETAKQTAQAVTDALYKAILQNLKFVSALQ